VTKDKANHNLLDRPRDVPVRTALGVMSLTFYMILVIAGANDILANTFHWSLQATTWVLRFLLIALPPIAFKITKRFCLGLQHHDEALLHHGVETGIIRMLPSGEYIEVEEPLPAEKAQVLAAQIGYDLNGHAAIAGSNGHAASNGHVASNGHASSNGHAASNGHGANGATAAAAPSNSSIKKPVGLAETMRLRLEKFWVEDRQSVPDPHAADTDSPAHH
jgi:hypothetical protein